MVKNFSQAFKTNKKIFVSISNFSQLSSAEISSLEEVGVHMFLFIASFSFFYKSLFNTALLNP
jgi:hypothetical protein